MTDIMVNLFTNEVAVMNSYLTSGASLLDATPYVVTEVPRGAFAFKKHGDAFNWSASGTDATSFTHETAHKVVAMVADQFPEATVTSKRDFYTKSIAHKEKILAALHDITKEDAE